MPIEYHCRDGRVVGEVDIDCNVDLLDSNSISNRQEKGELAAVIVSWEGREALTWNLAYGIWNRKISL